MLLVYCTLSVLSKLSTQRVLPLFYLYPIEQNDMFSVRYLVLVRSNFILERSDLPVVYLHGAVCKQCKHRREILEGLVRGFDAPPPETPPEFLLRREHIAQLYYYRTKIGLESKLCGREIHSRSATTARTFEESPSRALSHP